MSEVMSLPEFEGVVRRNARFDSTKPLGNALAAAIQSITENPAFAQSRLLNRLLHALTHDKGEFRRAEASVFDAPTLRLAVALMDAAGSRTNSHEEWLAAVAETDAACSA